jgi:glycine cleavage system aminomethyltransferase T
MFSSNRGDSAAISEALNNGGAQSVSEDTFETLRIEAGIPRYGIDMGETNVVTETNLDDAVSFTKGLLFGAGNHRPHQTSRPRGEEARRSRNR